MFVCSCKLVHFCKRKVCLSFEPFVELLFQNGHSKMGSWSNFVFPLPIFKIGMLLLKRAREREREALKNNEEEGR